MAQVTAEQLARELRTYRTETDARLAELERRLAAAERPAEPAQSTKK